MENNFDLRKFLAENKSVKEEQDTHTIEESADHAIQLLMGVLGSAGVIGAAIGIGEFQEKAKEGKYGPQVQKLVLSLEKRAGEVNRMTGNTHEEVEESAPGYEHDCAAHVVHETYGYGVCIEGQHTLLETSEGKGEVTHYDVFFKKGGIVKDVPVNELKIMTSETHTHSKKKTTKEELFKEEIRKILK